MTSDLLKNYIKASLGPGVLSKVAPFLLSVPAAVTVDPVVPGPSAPRGLRLALSAGPWVGTSPSPLPPSHQHVKVVPHVLGNQKRNQDVNLP